MTFFAAFMLQETKERGTWNIGLQINTNMLESL